MRSGSWTRFEGELSFPLRECFDRVVAPSISSPCERPYRLGLLLIDLTPADSLSRPSFSCGDSTSEEEANRSPKFTNASLHTCHSLYDPDEPFRANQLRSFSAGFPYDQKVAVRMFPLTRLYQL